MKKQEEGEEESIQEGPCGDSRPRLSAARKRGYVDEAVATPTEEPKWLAARELPPLASPCRRPH